MSGGTFDYNQYRIRDIANDIEQEIAKSGKPKSQRELKDEDGWRDNDEWYKKYPEELNHYKYPDEVIAEFKNAYEALRKAEIYAQRVDWLLACDDGEKSFLKRLKSDLEELKLELAIKTFEVEDDEDED
jgi:hypothetical protein